ncbi:band 3 anion transport protein-like isoform X2 [Watersipora subatra]|uniref:band 3 anion transport protein-like isoform X2 n=1 Tax=Watersipora subatra TaxID=2589382 RepID=UPI00355C299E
MSSPQLPVKDPSSASSLEDYDSFFEAPQTLEKQQPGSYRGLPLSEEGYAAPRPYEKEATEEEIVEHHTALFYPHTHQTLKNPEGRRKHKKKEVKYKKSKASRPSQLFQPSLQGVTEQDAEHLEWTPEDQTTDGNGQYISDASIADGSIPHSEVLAGEPGAAADRNRVQFTLGDQDSVDGTSLAGSDATQRTIKANNSAPSKLASTPNKPPVRFVIGGDASETTLSDLSHPVSQPVPQPHIIPTDDQVTFTIGAESSENFRMPGEGLLQPSIKRNRSKSIDDGQPAMNAPLAVRSSSYHQGQPMEVRRCRGSEVKLVDLPAEKMGTITSPEEAALLNRHDLEDLAAHRFEKLPGLRKHKIDKRSMSTFPVVPTDTQLSKTPCDLTPHELFVELDELVTRQHDELTDLMEWKEKARWIKFEEDVLETSDRWGRPHVASLSFHSLIELRRLLANGAVLVNVDVSDYINMMQAVVDQLVCRGHLPEDQKGYVMEALVLRHSHLSGKAKVPRSKSYGNLTGLESMSRHSKYSHFFSAGRSVSTVSTPAKKSKKDGDATDHVFLNIPTEDGVNPLIKRNSRSYANNLDKEKYNMELLKKIPQDSEVASVLVGNLKDLAKPCTALFRLSQGVMLEHVAEVPLPVRFLFVCVGPTLEGVEYLEIGRSLATLMSNKNFRDAVYTAREKDTILTAMNAFLDDSIVLPPGDFDRKTLLPIMHMARKSLKAKIDKKMAAQRQSLEMTDKAPLDDPLRRTGRPFGGLVNDVKRKLPFIVSDFKDGLNFQVFATFIFIYFACLSPAITFGGLLGEKTDNYMGASEMLMATAVSGILFSLFGGQPLIITGFTGPNMVFEDGVYKFSKSFGIDLLTWRLWMGVWVFVLSIVMVATEASFLVKFVTRFTHEIFAFLISLIFLWEVVNKLIKVYKAHPICISHTECLALFPTTSTSMYSNLSTAPSHSDSLPNYCCPLPKENITDPTSVYGMQANTALLTTMLILGTFVLAYAFKGIRNKKILGRTIRRALGDFGVPLTIVLMCVIDLLVGDRVFVEKLQVTEKFSVTDPSKRGWLVSPLGTEQHPFPISHIFSAILPAILASILIFLETLIAGTIVDKKENKLQKGSAFHLDILIVGVAALINGFLGVPFVCAATVRTVSHTSALTIMSTNHAPGERAKLERVIEQRLSNLLVHLLMAASLFLGVLLKYIPTAVLFGVFLYMGVASLSGIQMFDRIFLLLTPTKHHPVDVGYVRHMMPIASVISVRARKMHLFTIIQVICLAILWTVKLSPGALAFPFVLILLVPLCRFVLPLAFTSQELSELDSEDEGRVLAAVDDDELDFYETAHMPD